MKKTTVGVIGAGQIGIQIGKIASEYNDVVFFDIDRNRSKEAAQIFNAHCVDVISEILNSDILFLAVPKRAVIELFQKYYAQASKETLWVNVCTFVTLKDILCLTGDITNVVSCKIIGHFEMMSPTNRCAFVIHDEYPESELTSIVEHIFRKVGIVVHDNEDKYLEVNYIAASEGMKGVIRVANILKELNIDSQIINAAIRQVFLGTAQQFPYANPDYFHNLVYERNPGLKELNEEILKIF